MRRVVLALAVADPALARRGTRPVPHADVHAALAPGPHREAPQLQKEEFGGPEEKEARNYILTKKPKRELLSFKMLKLVQRKKKYIKKK